MDLPREHQIFLERTIESFRNDLRMEGLAVAGSCITNTMDEYSDLDFIIVVNELHYDKVMAERMQIAETLGKLLAAFTAEHVGEPRLLICLYDEPLLHVDLKFVTRHDFRKRIEDPIILWEREAALSSEMRKMRPNHPMPDMQWIEDRFWVWIHYAAVKLGRGELFEVIDFLAFVRSSVLGPLSLVSHGHLPRGVRRLELLVPADSRKIEKTVATHDIVSCVESIRASIGLYQKFRTDGPVPNLVRRERAEIAAVAYFEKIASEKLVPR
jgi:hypothetical protein